MATATRRAPSAQTLERRERFKAMVKQVAAMTDEERAALAARAWIRTADDHALSVRNACLVAMQRPDATIVGGFKQWLKHGRAVAKGEHGMMIWFPRKLKGDQSEGATGDEPRSERDELRFMIGTVFDVSQTVEVETGADHVV